MNEDVVRSTETSDEQPAEAMVRVLLESDPETGMHMRDATHLAVVDIPAAAYRRWKEAETAYVKVQYEMRDWCKSGGGNVW